MDLKIEISESNDLEQEVTIYRLVVPSVLVGLLPEVAGPARFRGTLEMMQDPEKILLAWSDFVYYIELARKKLKESEGRSA